MTSQDKALGEHKSAQRLDRNLDHHQNLITCSFYHPRHKLSSQSVHNFLNNVANKQTDRQINPTANIISFSEIINVSELIDVGPW